MDSEPFISIDMLDFDERLTGVIEGLTKDGFKPEIVLKRARELNIRREIRARLQREFDAPSPDLVKHFARGLYAGGYDNATATEFTNIVKQEWQELARSQAPADRPAVDPPAPELTVDHATSGPPASVCLVGNLLEIPIFAKRLGKRIDRSDAMLIFYRSNTKKSNIRFGGDEVSVNDALLRAIHLVHPNHKSPGGRGWYDWIMSDPATGELRSIDDLRRDNELFRRVLETAKS